jgi:hypothetical protein
MLKELCKRLDMNQSQIIRKLITGSFRIFKEEDALLDTSAATLRAPDQSGRKRRNGNKK